jgi:hypothetical protein
MSNRAAILATETLSEKRRRAAMSRTVHSGGTGNRGGGRPRKAERCPCGANTLARAMARGSADERGLFACCKAIAGGCE